jgi:hypothetical protein
MMLECECGYVAEGDTGQALVRAAQRHAWDVHQTTLPGPTILALAGRRSTGTTATTPSGH